MYFEIVKQVLDETTSRYEKAEGISHEDLCKKMGERLAAMSNEHHKDRPQIPYDDPVCRLAYLYMHAAANATAFERALGLLDSAQEVLKARAGKTLRVCLLGGGPGPEVLGLCKFIVHRHKLEAYLPARIEYALIDVVPEWGETWNQLAKQAEGAFCAGLEEAQKLGAPAMEAPVIVPAFYSVDATAASSFKKFGWLMSDVDVFVLNYFISENLDRLDDLALALEALVAKAAKNAVFMFIDRKEHTDRITKWLGEVLPRIGFKLLDDPKPIGGALDGDEQTTSLGDFVKLVGRVPRVKFFTNMIWRSPTAFCLAARRSM